MFRDVTVPDAHPLVIDEAMFNQAAAIMDARGDEHSRRASNMSEYHLTGRIRCPNCGKALVGTAANGRSKTHRYYTCKTCSRYGTDACNNYRLPADGVDEAVLDALARFYRDHTDLIADAVTQAVRDHDAGVGEMRAECTAVEKELTRASTGIDRYMQAFENGELTSADVKDRIAALKEKVQQLATRRDDLLVRLSHAPTMPSERALAELAD